MVMSNFYFLFLREKKREVDWKGRKKKERKRCKKLLMHTELKSFISALIYGPFFFIIIILTQQGDQRRAFVRNNCVMPEGEGGAP